MENKEKTEETGMGEKGEKKGEEKKKNVRNSARNKNQGNSITPLETPHINNADFVFKPLS